MLIVVHVLTHFFLIAVDIDEEVAYWEHISTKWFEDEKLDDQKYKTVHLTNRVPITKGDTEYVEEWQDIVNRTKKKINNYEHFQKLKEKSNPAIGEVRAGFEAIHHFLDRYHDLLEGAV